MIFLKIHCLSNASLKMETYLSPNIYIILEDVHRVHLNDIQKTYSKIMQRTEFATGEWATAKCTPWLSYNRRKTFKLTRRPRQFHCIMLFTMYMIIIDPRSLLLYFRKQNTLVNLLDLIFSISERRVRSLSQVENLKPDRISSSVSCSR